MLKKTVSGLLLMLLLATVYASPFNIHPVKAEPATIVVPDDYPTIQSAIDHASEGDIVYVRAGTYQENVEVGRSVYLIGENNATTIIDGGGQESVITVSANNVVIRNFTVRNSAYAMYGRLCAGICIEIPGSFVYNVLISGNVITNNGGDGIALYYASNNTVLGNNITNNFERSIFLYVSSDNSIRSNNITANNIGISIQESSNNSINENNIANNGYGIYFTFLSDYNRFYRNNFLDNTRQVEFHPQSGYNNFCDNGYPSGGNYWSNHNGTDVYSGPYQNITGGDGICDMPYIIDADNVDHYPLMNLYGSIQPRLLVGDINSDGEVNILDLVRILLAYYSDPTSPSWNPSCDLNGDQFINIQDIAIAASHFGEKTET